MADFINEYGNFASVISLVITILGFAATLYRLWTIGVETKQAERLAQQGIQKLGSLLLAFEINTLNHLMTEFMEACREDRWPKAFDKCELVKTSATRLTEHPYLEENERIHFRAIYDDLSIVQKHVDKNHKTGINKELTKKNQMILEKARLFFLRIESRLRHSSLEV